MSRFFCTKCGNEGIPILRKAGHERPSGHLKKLYCLKCNQEWNHCEVVENSKRYTVEDFYIEFNGNNFDEKGLRKDENFIHNVRMSGLR